jgi:hypothetical protein
MFRLVRSFIHSEYFPRSQFLALDNRHSALKPVSVTGYTTMMDVYESETSGKETEVYYDCVEEVFYDREEDIGPLPVQELPENKRKVYKQA